MGVQSSKACSRSYVMKFELFSSRYMSLGLVHLMVFWCGDIHAASFGAVQFSFGATAPPSSAIPSPIVWCSSGNLWFGGSLGASSSSSSLSSSESTSSGGGRNVDGADSHSSSSGSTPSSSARMMPSSRMYSTNSGESGIIRDLIHEARYLAACKTQISLFQVLSHGIYALGKPGVI